MQVAGFRGILLFDFLSCICVLVQAQSSGGEYKVRLTPALHLQLSRNAAAPALHQTCTYTILLGLVENRIGIKACGTVGYLGLDVSYVLFQYTFPQKKDLTMAVR